MIEKVNVNVCTDIEQSKRLLELGIPSDSADMVILDRVLNANHVNVMHKNDICKDLYEDEEQKRIIPAWSIDALYKLVELAITRSDEFLTKVTSNGQTR